MDTDSVTGTTGTLPFEAGDPEWVADLFETFREGDLDATIERLEELAALIGKAAKARRMLATVDPRLLKQGLLVMASRRENVQ